MILKTNFMSRKDDKEAASMLQELYQSLDLIAEYPKTNK